MYYYLKGTIVELKSNSVVIDVNNIGYEVLVTDPNNYQIGDFNTVYIVHVVREDEEYFVGFKSLVEKDFFNKLIQVKGIGPKTALSSLRGITVEEYIEAIENEDIKKLKKLEGIGPKAASQIILDLKGTLSTYERSTKTKHNQEQLDAILALKTLGFKAKDVEEVIDSIEGNNLSTQDYITQALRMIKK